MEEFTVFVGGLNFRRIEMSFSLMGLIFKATGYIFFFPDFSTIQQMTD